MTPMLRLLGFLTPFWWRVALASLLGVLTVASGVGLLGMAAYLIAAAALKPLLITLLLPSYLVRLLSVTRAVARYTDRLVSHDLTFRLLARVRTRFYAAFTPLAPSRLLAYRSGDVLARHLKDVEDLQNLYQGIIAPFVVALAITGLTVCLLHAFAATLAWAALEFLCAAGVGVPLLNAALSRGHGSRYVQTRAELSAQLVDAIQGVQDLLAHGAAGRRVRAVLGIVKLTTRRRGALTQWHTPHAAQTDRGSTLRPRSQRPPATSRTVQPVPAGRRQPQASGVAGRNDRGSGQTAPGSAAPARAT
jgi:ATP-binding cassette subfamily C protein CydC